MSDVGAEMISVLVNNFNYGRFLHEAIESVLQQSAPPDEIVIVDDGSTDDSIEVLGRYKSDNRFKIIAKQNGGQLSAFNAGFTNCSGEIVLFLDADDRYTRRHVEKVCETFGRRPDVDFVATSYRAFGSVNEDRHNPFPDGCLGFSLLRTYLLNSWIGSVTSSIAMRRSLLERVLPYSAEKYWTTRADDCLVIGSSLRGAKKFFSREIGAEYRVHEGNHFAGRKLSVDQNYRYQQARLQLLRDFAGDRLPPSGQGMLLTLEAQSVETMRLSDWLDYLRVWWRIHDAASLKHGALLSLLKLGLRKFVLRR